MNKITSLEIYCDGCTYLYVYREHNRKRYNIADTQRLDRVRELVGTLPPPHVSFGVNDTWLSFQLIAEHSAKEQQMLDKTYAIYKYDYEDNIFIAVKIAIAENLEAAVAKTLAYLEKEGEVTQQEKVAWGLAEFRVTTDKEYGVDLYHIEEVETL